MFVEKKVSFCLSDSMHYILNVLSIKPLLMIPLLAWLSYCEQYCSVFFVLCLLWVFTCRLFVSVWLIRKFSSSSKREHLCEYQMSLKVNHVHASLIRGTVLDESMVYANTHVWSALTQFPWSWLKRCSKQPCILCMLEAWDPWGVLQCFHFIQFSCFDLWAHSGLPFFIASAHHPTHFCVMHLWAAIGLCSWKKPHI